MKNVKIAREEKTIYVSKNFLINASQFGTPEFNELMDAKRNYPTFEVKEYKIKRNPSKQTYPDSASFQIYTFKILTAQMRRKGASYMIDG